MAEFYSISSVEHVEEAAIIAEIQAILSGEFNLSEMPFDRDLLSASFLAKKKKEGVAADEITYLEKEPETCFQDARSNMEGDIALHLAECATLLGHHFPFKISGKKSSIITPKEDISPVGMAYIWFRIYILSISGHDYIQFDDSSTTKKKKESVIFKKNFAKVFEYLAAFAVSGKYGNTVWMTASSRSGRKYRKILKNICNHIGAGKVKKYKHLLANQKSTNDGRYDIIVLTTPRNLIRNDSELYLVQATIQKTGLKIKTMTQTEITFFNDFFVTQLQYAKHGILVVPHQFNALHKSECGTANCVYMPRTQIMENLSSVPQTGLINDIGNLFVQTYSNIETQFPYQRF